MANFDEEIEKVELDTNMISPASINEHLEKNKILGNILIARAIDRLASVLRKRYERLL